MPRLLVYWEMLIYSPTLMFHITLPTIYTIYYLIRVPYLSKTVTQVGKNFRCPLMCEHSLAKDCPNFCLC